MKKIDIFYKNDYVCTTTQSKTCKEAKENFINNPIYRSASSTITIENIDVNSVKCRFQK